MRDEDCRQAAVERYQRLGAVDIWEHTLTNPVAELEDDLMACSPPGYGFGPVPWTDAESGFFPEEWFEDPEAGRKEYEARNQRT